MSQLDAPRLGAPTDAIRLRALGRGEAWVVREVFAGLSEQSRMRRFHAPVHQLSGTMVERLAAVGNDDHVAVAAEVLGHDGWRPIGITRLVRTAPGEAEMAIAVVDRWQRQGIGRRLLVDLRERAARLGHVSVTGSILVGNEPMLALVRSVFPGVTIQGDGRTWEIVAPVPPAPRRRRISPRRGRTARGPKEERRSGATRPRTTARRRSTSPFATSGGRVGRPRAGSR